MKETGVQDILPEDAGRDATGIAPLAQAGLDAWLTAQPQARRDGIRAAGFRAEAGETLIAPMADGGVAALLGLGGTPDAWAFARAAEALPPGDYRLDAAPEGMAPERIALCWALGTYRFTRYKARVRPAPRLTLPLTAAQRTQVAALYESIALARDLVNTPANDMGPAQLQQAAEALAAEFGARTSAVIGDDLLSANYPMIHAVGRASPRAPRLIELDWGDDAHPRLALVGKGVCFDSGGLDIKPSGPMRLMKKDMGGAANTLALARLVMASNLPVRLHVVIAAVDNAISGDAFRPGDILQSRKGLTVEIDNTDAEGRLVLGDALTRAAERRPDLTLDFATLTGAARVALGPQVAPFYTDDDALAAQIESGARAMDDPVWRMPLWRGYDDMLKSPVADLVNSPANSLAGSIAAALFLQRFAPDAAKGEGAWAHFDIFAWNAAVRPGRPVGGEAQGILAAFDMLRRRFPA